MVHERQRWTHELTGYHWFVFLVASAAWFFDCLDQRLFSLARIPALTALMPADTEVGVVQATGKEVTAVFLVGWGIGGLIFGAFGDRYGRARMLNVTVLIYSLFTGLTFFSQTYWDFALFRFLTGLGVGGVFGLAVALIAETLPDSARAGRSECCRCFRRSAISRPDCLIIWSIGCSKSDYITPGEGWRYMFLVGSVPALLVIATGKYLREPERWLRAKEEGKLKAGSIFAPYRGFLAERRWRKNLVIGALLASTGVIGLWAIGEYAVDLQRNVFKTYYMRECNNALIADGIEFQSHHRHFLGLHLEHARCGHRHVDLYEGRDRDRAPHCVRPGLYRCSDQHAACVLEDGFAWDAYWMMPLMGAAQLSVFAGFAIYLPELFPKPNEKHGHVVLLQPGSFRRGRRQLVFRGAGDTSLRQFRLAAQGTLFGHGDVRDLPRRVVDVAVCAGDEGSAVARVTGHEI